VTTYVPFVIVTILHSLVVHYLSPNMTYVYSNTGF